jgi:predicted Zn-ribbon and HTH transcriptional regulator
MSVIISRIRKQVDDKENSFQAMVLGMSGTGKSFSGIRLCEMLDPNFDVSRIIFTPQDFMKLINSDIAPGSAILADEIGSWLSSRDWQTTQNKLMSIVLETYRYRRLIVVWTVPHARMVDRNLRDMCHVIVETIAVDRKNDKCLAKFKYHKTNPLTGNEVNIFPRKRREDGQIVTLTTIKFNRPSKEIEKAYLRKKDEHMKGVYAQIETDLNKLNKPQEKIEMKPNARCEKCNYTWTFTGRTKPSCPSCRSSFVVVQTNKYI